MKKVIFLTVFGLISAFLVYLFYFKKDKKTVLVENNLVDSGGNIEINKGDFSGVENVVNADQTTQIGVQYVKLCRISEYDFNTVKNEIKNEVLVNTSDRFYEMKKSILENILNKFSLSFSLLQDTQPFIIVVPKSINGIANTLNAFSQSRKEKYLITDNSHFNCNFYVINQQYINEALNLLYSENNILSHEENFKIAFKQALINI